VTLSSAFWRVAHKWPRIQRIELLEVPDLGIRYINIPKTGTGSTRMAVYHRLCDLAGEQLDKSVLWEHTRWVRKEDVPGLEPSFTFAFARNPYARLASVYRHKILRARQAGKRVSPLFFVYPRRFSLDMSFADFVRAVSAIPDRRAEKHFRSQSASLFLDGEPLTDFLGRVEHFERDWAVVVDGTGMEPLRRGYNRTDAEGSFDMAEWYDADLVALVNDRYAEDFERLGYPRSSA
jgi:hypothetical protein